MAFICVTFHTILGVDALRSGVEAETPVTRIERVHRKGDANGLGPVGIT
jgi:hypothetical protein